MPHQRSRHLLPHLKKQLTFWPVIGLMGLRQVGKSTLIRNQLPIPTYLSFDDEDTRSDAEASAKAFLAKHERPLILDEAQKVPKIFDAIKSTVDKNRIPGQFILSGSSRFSAQQDIQESLTGRIALCYLFPFTLAETHHAPLQSKRTVPLHHQKTRFTIEQMAAQLPQGGLPVPLFMRSASQKQQYWTQWINTSLGRDLKRVYGKGYDDSFAEKILQNLLRLLVQGVQPSIADFDFDSRKANRYLKALESIFLVRKMPCHHLGTGRDTYTLTDSGMLQSLSLQKNSPHLSLSLIRCFILNEIIANFHYTGKTTDAFCYYKSRKGDLVDLVWQGIPIKFITSLQRMGWEQRALEGAMKKLKVKHGLLVGPTDHVDIPKRGGVGLVPWTFWS